MPSLTVQSSSLSSTNETMQRLTVLRETTSEASAKCRRAFGHSSEEVFSSTRSVDDLLDYIAAERLRRMPHRGSKWDKVLHWAAYFASHVQLFHEAVCEFVPQSHEAVRLIYGNCRLLLQMGPYHIVVLEKIFSEFYSVGRTLAFFHNNSDSFSLGTDVQQSLAYVFSDVVSLVVDVTAQYGVIGKASSHSFSSNEFAYQFSGLIESIYSRKDQISVYLWSQSIQHYASSKYTVDIETLRQWLQPTDRTVRSLSSIQSGQRETRAEYTCEWFHNTLMSFARSQQNVMVVAGKAGCGKSFLSAWIAERLSRVEGRGAHDVISYSVNEDVKAQTTVTAVLKDLLLQLIDRRVGDIDFYDVLRATYEESAKAQSTHAVDEALWQAIDFGLKSMSNIMIVLDGLNALRGGETVGLKLLDRLSTITSKHTHAKAITLTTPLSKAVSQQLRSYTIENSNVEADIRSFVHESVTESLRFRHLKHDDIDRLSQKISTSADGCYVWAILALEILKKEKTVSGIFQTLEALPKALSDIMTKVTNSIDLKNHDTRSLLAWLMAAERPLTLSEIKVFFEIDLRTCSHRPRFSDVEQDTISAIGPIISIHGGLVRFRHSTFRQHFMALAGAVQDYSNTGDFPFMIKEAHYDLCTRILAYVKLFVTKKSEPSVQSIERDVLSSLYQGYTCLEYATTYWISHFYESPMYDPEGDHKLVPEFTSCFPNSTLLAQIEGVAWQSYSAVDFELALKIRRSILGETVTVLQTTIQVAKTWEASEDYNKASTYWYSAYNMTQKLLGEDHELITFIAASYISCTSGITVTERTDVVVQRETMLKRITAFYRNYYGASNDNTVRYIRILAQLYTDSKQFDLAVDVWEEVYNIYVEKYGRHSKETTSVYETYRSVIKQSSKKDRLDVVSREQYEFANSYEATDERRKKTSKELFDHYESQGQHAKAEEVLISLWHAICRTASSSHDVSVQKEKIDITTRYAKFLKSQKRTTEAATILEGLWSEYKNETVQSEAIAVSLRSVAEEMRSVGILKQATLVFSSLVSYYQRTSKMSSTEATTVATELSETTREIVETSTSTTTTSSTITEASTKTVDESTMKEIYSSMLATTTTSSSSLNLSTLIKTSQQLITFYARQARWAECYSTCTQTLQIIWSSITTHAGQPTLPKDNHMEAIEIAFRMAEAGFAMKQIHKVEQTYTYVFQACKGSLKLTDEIVWKAAKNLLFFYEQVYMYEKALKTYGELYREVKSQLGVSHRRTILLAYEIGDFCQRVYRFRDAEPYYYDIYMLQIKGKDTVDDEALQAAKALLIIYEQDARWEVAENLVVTLWKTWTTKKTEARFTTEFVELIYNNYIHILQDVKQSSYEEIYKVTKTFKETCTSVYGARNELTIKATLEFAQVCERTETHKEEAVTQYEEAVKQSESLNKSSTAMISSTTTAVITTAVSKAKRSLASHYAASSSSETRAKASSIFSEEFESTRNMYGYSDSRTIKRATELVSLNAKQTTNKEEYTRQSLMMLQNASVQTLLEIKDTEQLMESAKTIAESYKSINQTETAWELVREARRQIITGDHTSRNSKFNFSMKGTDRRAYTFIIVFEQTLWGGSSTSQFSELMADLMNETLLYQTYRRCVAEKTKFEITLENGYRLAIFYKTKQRTEEYKQVYNEILALFAEYMAASKTSPVLREFFELCITEAEAHGNGSQYCTAVVQITVERILTRCKESKFQEAHDLAAYTDALVLLHYGWRSVQLVEAGFQICLYLTGHAQGIPRCSDKALFSSLQHRARSILSSVLVAARDLHIALIQLPVDTVNSIVALLSTTKSYQELETILSDLWAARHGQAAQGWTSVTVVQIGRRLVEVRYVLERRDAAIHLCEDMHYNLRRVWGPLDATTLELGGLLGELYASNNDHARAIGLYEDILTSALTAYEDGEVTADAAAQVAAQHLELLRRAYARNGGWPAEKPAGSYKELYTQLHAEFGKDKHFSQVASFDKWSVKDKVDARGVWTRPETFEFLGFGAAKESHTNNLGRTSGLVGGVTAVYGASPIADGKSKNRLSLGRRVTNYLSRHRSSSAQEMSSQTVQSNGTVKTTSSTTSTS